MRPPRQILQRVGRRIRPVRRPAPSDERHPDLAGPTEPDRHYLTSLYDDRVPLPAGADVDLSSDHPRLEALRRTYRDLALPVCDASRWRPGSVDSFLDLRYFRGETLFYWHYRELPRATTLKYFVLLQHVLDRDPSGLLDKLHEDGAFGCWTFAYPGYATVSRDLLESVIEISFMERELGLSSKDGFSVLDIGAGYGRLAYRMTQAYPQLRDYCCVDAVPEATFISEYYLRHRGCTPPARVVGLDALDEELQPDSFDLAINIHSFSECTHAAVSWWVQWLARLHIPRLLLVPNEPADLLTLEADGSRRNFLPLLEEAGYRRTACEPLIDDPAIRDLLPLHDHFHLFALRR